MYIYSLFICLFLFLLQKIPVRHFDYRDDALFQIMCILRMMAFIFYQIDDLPDYLIVWYGQDISSNYMCFFFGLRINTLIMYVLHCFVANSLHVSSVNKEKHIWARRKCKEEDQAAYEEEWQESFKQGRKQKYLRKKDDDECRWFL